MLNKIKNKVSLDLNDTLSFLDILLGSTHKQFNIYCLMADGLTASLFVTADRRRVSSEKTLIRVPYQTLTAGLATDCEV